MHEISSSQDEWLRTAESENTNIVQKLQQISSASAIKFHLENTIDAIFSSPWTSKEGAIMGYL